MQGEPPETLYPAAAENFPARIAKNRLRPFPRADIPLPFIFTYREYRGPLIGYLPPFLPGKSETVNVIGKKPAIRLINCCYPQIFPKSNDCKARFRG